MLGECTLCHTCARVNVDVVRVSCTVYTVCTHDFWRAWREMIGARTGGRGVCVAARCVILVYAYISMLCGFHVLCTQCVHTICGRLDGKLWWVLQVAVGGAVGDDKCGGRGRLCSCALCHTCVRVYFDVVRAPCTVYTVCTHDLWQGWWGIGAGWCRWWWA